MKRAAAAAASFIAALGFIVVPGVALPSPAAASTGEACKPGNVVYAPQTPSALTQLDADTAHTLATGAGITVAVVDSGVDANNAHLRDAVVGGINLVGDPERADGLSDLAGHGTAIAGQIAARPVPGSGVVGIAPRASILSVRVFRSTSEQDVKAGFGPNSQRIAAGIRYAADQGAQVINVSMSQSDNNPALRDAVSYATSRGSLVVASAGNRASDEDAADAVRYPAGYEEALGVTATDATGRATADSIHGPQVDISAPGTEVLTATTGGGDCLYGADGAASSFATGYVSGIAALLAQTAPTQSPTMWAYRLTATALRDNPDARDNINGWGFVQPVAALKMVPSPTTRGPASPFFDTSASGVDLPTATVPATLAPSPYEPVTRLGVLIAVVGATAIALFVIVLVPRRRRAEADDDGGPERAGGLFPEKSPATVPVVEQPTSMLAAVNQAPRPPGSLGVNNY